MDPLDAKRITKNLLFIKENITQIEKIMDRLIEDECIGMDERSEILSVKRTDKQCHQLIDILLKRGGNSFKTFLEALELSGNHHVATRIRQTDTVKDGPDLLHMRDDTFTINAKVAFEEEEVLQLYEEKQMYEDRVKELEVNCRLLQNENSLKGHKIEKLKQNLQFLQDVDTRHKYDEIDNEDTSCRQHIKRLDELEGKYENLEEENNYLKIVQNNLYETMQEKEVTMKNLDKERQFYKRQVDILNEALKKLQKENAGKDAMIKSLNEQIKHLSIDLQNTKLAMEKMTAESNIAMEHIKHDHARRFNQLDNKLDCVLKMLKNSSAGSAHKESSADSGKNRLVRNISVVSDKPVDKNIMKGKQPPHRNNKP